MSRHASMRHAASIAANGSAAATVHCANYYMGGDMESLYERDEVRLGVLGRSYV